MFAPRTLFKRVQRALVPLVLPCLGCGSDPSPTVPPPEPPPIPQRVLFIGNSLTGTNDLPSMVQALAHTTGIDSFEAGQVVADGYSLDDHLATGVAAQAIATRRWEFVVLQNRSTADGAQLRRGVRAFAALADSAGSEVGLLGVWPPRSSANLLDESISLHKQVAEESGVVLIPAGAAWRAAWQVEPLIELYSPDESAHPSIQGTYLAALVIYARLFHRSPVGLPYQFRYGIQNLFRVNIPAAVAAVLQSAALRALAEADSATASSLASHQAGGSPPERHFETSRNVASIVR